MAYSIAQYVTVNCICGNSITVKVEERMNRRVQCKNCGLSTNIVVVNKFPEFSDTTG